MVSQSFSLHKKPVISIDDFLNQYEDILESGLDTLLNLDFKLNKVRTSEKLITSLRIAEPSDSEDIANLFKEIYHGSYPFKNMEDPEEISLLMEKNKVRWILFISNNEELAGCFGANLKFKNKVGLLYGFIIRKKFRHIVDSLKAFTGSLIYFWNNYKKQIPIWIGEIRTNNPAPQFATALCGLKPIAFYPNKDIFFGREESEFLHIAYSDEVLNQYRRKDLPKIILPVIRGYAYAQKRYKLPFPELVEEFSFTKLVNYKFEDNRINSTNVASLKRKIKVQIERDKYKNESINFSLNSSYFKFIYNPYSRSIEKTKYNISYPEELQAFLINLREFIYKRKVNYFQCFVSAYKPIDQRLFYNMKFKPNGYLPCWKYNKESRLFGDSVVFNYSRTPINENIKLIPETRELLEVLGYYGEVKSNGYLEQFLSYK
ncbi:MAG: hypothetical protein ACFE85_11920 [Candidatus Hodarchaeota archaeon]